MATFKYDPATGTYTLVDDTLLNGVVAGTVISTDQSDYSPGQTVQITGTFDPGSAIQLTIAHDVDAGADGIWGTSDDLLTFDLTGTGVPWTQTADINGLLTTSWSVGNNALNQNFEVIAVEQAADGTFTGPMSTTFFTDGPPALNQDPTATQVNMTGFIPLQSTTVNGAVFTDDPYESASGSGIFPAFVQIDGAPNTTEQGYNYDRAGGLTAQFDEKNDATHNHKVLLSDITVLQQGQKLYYAFALDVNEPNNVNTQFISLDELKIYTASSGHLTNYDPDVLAGGTGTAFGNAATLVYDMDGQQNTAVLLNANAAGSGKPDLSVLVPVENFGNVDPTETYVYLYSAFGYQGGAYTADSGFEEWSTPQVPGVHVGVHIDKVTGDGPGGSIVDGDGVQFAAGAPVTWTYTVTNTGNEPLSDVVVTDNQLGTLYTSAGGLDPTHALAGMGETVTLSGDNGDGVLQISEIWTFTVTGATAITGDYSNIGTVTGDYLGLGATSSDPSSYTGLGIQPNASLSLDKTTVDMGDPNGAPNDGDNILVGENIQWRYEVTNTGSTTLTNIVVTDDNGTPGNSADDFTVGTIVSLAPGASVTLTHDGIAAAGNYTNTGTASDGTISADDQSSYFGEQPGISIVKNTQDMNDPAGKPGDGINILAGEAIQWQYHVTNTGNVNLTNVTVVDDMGTVSTSDDVTFTIGSLAAGASVDLSQDGVAGVGSYHNTATVTADNVTDTAGHSVPVDASDDSSYFGENPGISILKNTQDMNAPAGTPGDGIDILAGEAIQWQYHVTNTGNVDLTNVTVVDDMGTVSTADDVTFTIGSLAAGASVDLTQDGVAGVGSYHNTATVTADNVTDTAGHSVPVTASDDSSYFGENPGISVVKNTQDMKAPAGSPGDGSTILAGEAIQWQYHVTNTGNVDLTNVTVVDDMGTVSTADDVTFTIGALAAGASVDLTQNGIAGVGSYHNTATATADNVTDTAGHSVPVTASDDSSYFGANPQINIDKQTTGYDTPTHTVTGDGISILAGYGVTWTYTVTTDTGDNVPLSNVVVTDDKLGTLYNAALAGHTGYDATGLKIGVMFTGDNGDHILQTNETWVFTATGTAGLGSYSNIGTASGSFTDTAGHAGSDTDADPSSYTGTFTEQGGTLTQGFWGNHTDAWDNIAGNEGNPTKSAFGSHVLSSLDVNPSTGTNLLLGDTNHNGVADDAHDLWISIKLAATIESSSTAGDARVIMLQQAIAAQLNIDNGQAEPNNVIDEAVMWLTKQGAWSTVGVNVGTGAPVSNGFGGTVSTVSENGSHTALAGSSVSTSSTAWQGYVDVTDPSSGISDWNGGKEADGEGLKNALMWWNDGHLVTSAAGQVAYDTNGTAAGGINPATVNLNTLDEFWLTLHQQTGLTGIA